MSEILGQVALMAAALWPRMKASVVLHQWCEPVRVVVIDAADPDADDLASATGSTLTCAVDELGFRLREMCLAGANELLRAAGAPLVPAAPPVDLSLYVLRSEVAKALDDEASETLTYSHLESGVVVSNCLRGRAKSVRRLADRFRAAGGATPAQRAESAPVVRHLVASGVIAKSHTLSWFVGANHLSTVVVGNLIDVVAPRLGHYVRVVVEEEPLEPVRQDDGASR